MIGECFKLYLILDLIDSIKGSNDFNIWKKLSYICLIGFFFFEVNILVFDNFF